MTTRTVDLDVELLSGGLGKVTSKCSISGRPKANPEGVALMLRVVTSLFASPPGVATHLLEPAITVDLTGSGIAGGSDLLCDQQTRTVDASAGVYRECGSDVRDVLLHGGALQRRPVCELRSGLLRGLL